MSTDSETDRWSSVVLVLALARELWVVCDRGRVMAERLTGQGRLTVDAIDMDQPAIGQQARFDQAWEAFLSQLIARIRCVNT